MNFGTKAGFTLLEVLVALAIVAVGAVATLALSGDLVKRIADAKVMDDMAFAAMALINDEARNLRHPATKSGDCKYPLEHCTWKINTESLNLVAKDSKKEILTSTLSQNAYILRININCGAGQEVLFERLGGL